MTAAVFSARFDATNPVFGIFSDGRIHGSLSPGLFSRVMARVGLEGACVPFQVDPEDLGAAVASLRILHLAGAGVAAPYKERVVRHLDSLSEGARIIGAVNTIVRLKTVLKGYNTNAIGIMDALDERGFAVAGRRALVLGTGGAARAAVFILIWLHADQVWVAGRDPEAAVRLTAALGGAAVALSRLAGAARQADLVINATSVSSPEEGPELAGLASTRPQEKCRLLLDLNCGRRENFWRAAAEAARCPFCDGLRVLAYQARRSFFLWTGIEVSPEEFVSALHG
jgi:shikimate dehydrogenase